jgi:hypothetical protein
MNVTPVVHDNNGRNGDGHKNGKRCRNPHGDEERQQRDGNERFAEANRGTNEGCGKDNSNNNEIDCVDGKVSAIAS